MTNKFFKTLFAVAMVMGTAMGFVSCEDAEKEVTNPTVEVSEGSLNFSNEEGAESVALTANGNWRVAVEYVTGEDWVVVTPTAGTGDATLSVSVPRNDSGAIREAVIKVIAVHSLYGDWDVKRITVAQSADETPTVEEVLLYGDNFDGKEATKTYGSGSSWPYIDQFPEFSNAEGPASENVTYSGTGVSVRANSNSDGNYSDYAGSGMNNIFFGSNAYFQVNDIALTAEQKSFKMTFGTEKYSQDYGSLFTPSEFHVYLSGDGNVWSEIEYTFAGEAEGRWNVATATFTLKEATENLYIKFTADVASSYRLDDLKLYTGNGGQEVDLANGSSTGGGNEGGGNEGGEIPADAVEATVAEFLAAAEDATVYVLTGEITRVQNEVYGNFDITDDTDTVYVYGLLTPSGEQQKQWTAAGLKEGDTITIYGKRSSYNGTPQMKNATYVSHTSGSGDDGGETPTPPTTDAYYFDNFDGEVATKTYGSGSSWPYIDQFPEFANATGSAAANVAYSGKGVSVRANSNSDGTYSDYAGSGKNNIFFGKEAEFVVEGIALEASQTKLQLTFGGDKYSQGGNSTYSTSELTVALSADGQAWTNVDYTFAGTADGRWNVATADFTLAAVPDKLYIKFAASEASVYRIDDVMLAAGNGGQTITLGEGGGETPEQPEEPEQPAESLTIAEVLALGKDATINGTIEGVVISNVELNNLTSKKGLYVQDATGGLQFYLAANHTFAFGTKLKIDLTGSKLAEYNGAVQVSGLALDKITTLSTGNAVEAKTVTIADFLANKYEGQYIAIEGVQVADADLGRTWVEGDAHTSINIEDANGNKFVVFSSKYATYGSQKVAQGSGTIKGISSISKGAIQILFAQTSDFAGLTGERFGGGETPEQPEQPEQPEEPEQPEQPEQPEDGGDVAVTETYSYEFAEKVYDGTGTQALGDLNWTLDCDTSYYGFDGPKNSDRGQQFGSSKNSCTYLTLSTSDFKTGVKKIVLNTSGASETNGECTVTVGGKKIGETITLTKTATDYTLESSEVLSGEIVISYTQTSQKALYIKSIKIN